MKVAATPVRDQRPTRTVVRYDDVPMARRAIDVLTCDHKVPCTRKPGGRIVIAHAEPCDQCNRGESQP